MQKEQLFIENDNFASLTAGNPIRLFPFGKLTRRGRVIEFTKELAAKMRLPNYKPAIKLGSHEDATPAGGFIDSLVVGEDGLYAVPAFTEKGAKAMSDGDYRYHSPEVIWEGTLEDVTQGDIEAPLITGLALLHDPALGSAAALYQVQESTQEHKMELAEQVNQIQAEQKTLIEKFTEFFSAKTQEAEQAEEYAAVKKERDEMAAKVAKIEAEQKAEELRAEIRGKHATDEFGAAFKGMGEDAAAVEMLAGMTPEQREWVEQKFAALSKQVEESGLTKELGKEGEADEPKSLHEQISAYAAEKKVSYIEALDALRKEKPEAFQEK